MVLNIPAFWRRSVSVLAFGVVPLAACESSPTNPTLDPGGTLTVNATSPTDWILVDLNGTAKIVEVSDPAASTGWDLGFQASKVTVNGGTSGPAGMLVHCICQNADATSEEVMAMTPESELGGYEAVTAAQIPASAADWSATTFDEKRWYRYNLTGDDHQIWPTHDVYLVKRGDDVYKLQLINYYNAAGDPRHITFRYAKIAD